MYRVRCLVALVLATLLLGAAPPHRVIHHPRYRNEVLIVPWNSPVRFAGWGKYETAIFKGRFLLSGKYSLARSDDCETPGSESCLEIAITPDPAIASRLPRWNGGDGSEMSIIMTREQSLIRSLASRQLRTNIASGKSSYVTGRTTIIADNLSTALDCGGPYFVARFVRMAKPPKQPAAKFPGGFGCGD